MHRTIRKIALTTAVATALCGTSLTASASGFAIIEQSVSGLGNAFAGGSAAAEDATTVFFNPAGMTRVGDSQVVGALHYIQPSTQFTDKGSTDATPTGGVPLTGGDGGDAGVAAVVPNVYYTTQLNDTTFFGLGVNAPFGLSTEYDDDWQGRYFGIKSAITTINLNPSLAFKASDKLSLGVGVNLQKLDAELTSAVDAASVCDGLVLFGIVLPCSVGGGGPGTAAPQSADGLSEVSGTSTAVGMNYGLLYQFTDDTRMGFAYRSNIRHRLEGEADFSNLPADLQAAGFLVDTDLKATLNLPATASLSVHHSHPAAGIAVMADATWTEWSSMDTLVLEVEQGAQGNLEEEFGWSNTMRYSVGATYSAIEKLVLRAGLALDQSPIQSKRKRGVRLPDSNRKWIALGAGYEFAKGMNLEVGFARLILDSADINRSEAGKGTIVGEYDANVNILSTQLAWTF